MAMAELVEIKFRLADGSDLGPNKYSLTSTVASLKEKIIAQWPKEKENGPKTIDDLKLINAGKILENNKTLAESALPVSEVPGDLITMHVVICPPIEDKNHVPPVHGATSWEQIQQMIGEFRTDIFQRFDELERRISSLEKSLKSLKSYYSQFPPPQN